ncbi:MAG: nucleotidyltransferase domain-containing protein [Bacteroidota bacterium]
MVRDSFAINTAFAFINECKTAGLTFRKVLLFGSYATGNFTEDSDIDLLLISDQFTDNIFDNLKLYSRINIKYPIIETHPHSTTSYNNGNEFIEEIEKSTIVIA